MTYHLKKYVHENVYITIQLTHVILSTMKIICDAAYIITNVEAKWPGSMRDSRIDRECSLSNRFARGKEAKALYKCSLSPFLKSLKCVLYNYSRVLWLPAGGARLSMPALSVDPLL